MFISSQRTRTSLPLAAQARLAWLLRLAACYLIPCGIGVVSLIALLLWHDQYSFSNDLPLDIRVLAQGPDPLTPVAALSRLATVAPVSGFDTHLVDTPFWFSFDTVHRIGGPEVLDFPSRHAVDLACWDTAGMTLLGSASRNMTDSAAAQALAPAKAGFALRLAFMPARLLCRAAYAGPGHVSVVQWPADQFELSIDQYHRKSGLLDGGMIVLAVFVLIIAAIQRQSLYAVFAGWLILNLRIGAMLAGWDIQWLGQMVPQPWLLVGRAVVVVLFGISTVTLYQMLLREHLVRLRQRLAVRIVQWLCVPMLVAAVVLPYKIFVPWLWAIVITGVCLLTCDLVRILFAARNRVAMYFAASLAVAFASGISRILAEVLDAREFEGAIDSVTAALTSSVLAALAVAEQIRIEMDQRIAMQAERGQTWAAVPVGLFTLDADGRFLSHNPALAAMLGGAPIVAGRTTWRQCFGASAWSRMDELLQSRQYIEMDIAQQASEAAQCRFLVRARLVNGRIEGVLDDITEQARETDHLRYLSRHDPMTGVFNRRGLEYAYDAACTSLVSGRPLALAFLDLDRFKLVNELYGHAAGDEVLRQVCERITPMLAGGQHIGRIGGDAFLVVMPDTTLVDAMLACGAIVARIGSLPYLVGDKAFTVHASLGVIEVAQGMLLADAMASADRACRAARAGARLAGPGDDREAQLVARLASPNATEGLFLDMQPVLTLAAPHHCLNVDVLLRMRTVDGGIIDAPTIIAAAEKSGRSAVVDRWVFTTMLAWIGRHAARLPTMHVVCIKVSAAALNDVHFVHDLLALLQRHADVAGRLCVVLSERVALQDPDTTRRFIEQVRAYGVKIALDEFGAAHTSLSYLRELPADLLKIDASFIDDLQARPANAAIVEAIVHLAGKLGMKTIAAGVDDSATVRALALLGVDYVQGDGVARARSLDAILAAQSAASLMEDAALPELLAAGDSGG